MAEHVTREREPATTQAHGAVTLRVAAQPHNLGILRALVSAAASFEDLDLDTVADLRLALDEAATALIRVAVPGETLHVVVQPHPHLVELRVSVLCPAGVTVIASGSFSRHVLNSLADNVDIFTDGENGGSQQVLGISLTMSRWSSLR